MNLRAKISDNDPAEGNPLGPGRISVVVPSYNHAPFVEKCLRSIMGQTLHPAELIVIDDGSNDDSPQIIERVLNNCPFPSELIARQNKGLCATLNEGFERCRAGEYFAYLASDDAWLPDFLRARAELLQSRPNAVLGYGHTYIVDERNRVIECTSDWARYRDGNVRQMLLRTTAPFSPTVLYRRTALERHRWNEASKLEDYELYLRLSADGDFAFDPSVLSAWRRHGSNTSHDLKFMINACIEAQRRVAPHLGISAKELEASHAAIKWRYAEDFIRSGHKRKALALSLGNLRGAPSTTSVVRMLARLLVPHRILRWRKRLTQRRANRRYGFV